MKVLLLGKNGQVGWELQRSLAPLGEVIALDRQGHEGLCGDLSQAEALAQTVRLVRPDVVVNAAAHTAVDRAESELDLAWAINAQAPAILAREAAALGALLVHYSTDYVFDGSGIQARTEDAITAPLSVYGRTKREGEQAIINSGVRHLIFRTSWVYAARGGNFAKTMLRLAKERERLTVVDDQWGAPTGADLIADVTAHVVREAIRNPEQSGLYHLAAAGETTWHGYAQFVIDAMRRMQPAAGWQVREVAPVPSEAFPTPAKRPANSRLDTTLLQSTFQLQLPHWQDGVARMLAEIA